MRAGTTLAAHLGRFPVPADGTPTNSAEQAAASDLLVCIWHDSLARYEGTRAQLEAEDVIPEGTNWPVGTETVSWEAKCLRFHLSRIRPKGMRGPRKLWVEGDYWCLDIDVPARDLNWAACRMIEKKANALRDELYRHSDAGRREHDENWQRYWAAREDEAFQAFKSIFVPQRKRPGRKPRAEPTQGSQQ